VAEIAETARKGGARDGYLGVWFTEHFPHMPEANLLDQIHRRVSPIRLERMENGSVAFATMTKASIVTG
jgi:hypothetical protein